ncbi:MAG TPA: TIGR03118 family protein [Mycobacteriales bacterium]|nr:TIGR03118 family protein [Mycobacteriales bacterium]
MNLVHSLSSTRARATIVAAVLAVPLAATPGVAAAGDHQLASPTFAAVNLVADVAGAAPVVDPHLVNAWGLAHSPTSPLWVANNGTSSATLYAGGAGGAPPTINPLVVTTAGGPTGQAFNGGTQFVVTGPSGSGPARFLFSTLSGDLLAWNPAAAPTTAISVSHVDGAVYTGLAIGSNEFGSFLLASDFRNGRIDVFNSLFQRSNLPAPAFTDPRLPRGYAPFNVDFLDGHAYVAYAKVDTATGRNQPGRGLGFVDVFNRFGQLERRLASHGTLNSPWGFEIAPDSFGAFAGDLLVGNFGDGRVNVFDRTNGRFKGQLRDAGGHVIVIPGLWDLLRGTANTGGTDAVWFSAGPGEETHGLVGLLRPAA